MSDLPTTENTPRQHLTVLQQVKRVLSGTNLPISSLIPDVSASLKQKNSLIVQAPPGAGKSTLLPLALLDNQWIGNKKVWLLEPRRLAARQVAERLASELGEPLGKSIGLITRQDTHTSADNRLVVMTEGILTRRLLADQSIEECGAILFDEFHERNLNSDLGLALAYECQQLLREDLRIIVMSATLSGESIAKAIDAPILTSEGRSFPVDLHYLGSGAKPDAFGKPQDALTQQVVSAVNKGIHETSGHILVFLPGVREIQRCLNTLRANFSANGDPLSSAFEVLPLHGQLSPAEQRLAVKGAQTSAQSSIRRIILSTSVAETSLTIEGIRLVIDSGLERTSRFNPRTGMDELVTISSSQASATQRAGRAGRLEAGVCYRLWSEDSHYTKPAFSEPDITQLDLAGLALTLACWGSLELDDYVFLTPPNHGRWQASLELLYQLEALSYSGNDQSATRKWSLTDKGQQMAMFGLHPRLANMLIYSARDRNISRQQACALAAVLSEGDPLKFDEPNSDLRDRVELIATCIENKTLPKRFRQANVQFRKTENILALTQQLLHKLNALIPPHREHTKTWNSHDCGKLLAYSYPDRVAQQRGTGFKLRSGQGIECMPSDPMQPQPYLVVADTSGHRHRSLMRLAAPIDLPTLQSIFSRQISTRLNVAMGDRQHVKGTESVCLGEIVLDERSFTPSREDIEKAWLDRIRQSGLQHLPWSEESQQLRARLWFAHYCQPESFPDAGDTALLSHLHEWLQPFMNQEGITKKGLLDALHSYIGWDKTATLDQQFPTRFVLPSEREAMIQYPTQLPFSDEQKGAQTPALNQLPTPLIQAKLQECFGLAASPMLADGKIVIGLELLSPGQKPLALTHDLPHFWQNVYPMVRKEMRGRYAKHPWPEDPMTAQATRLTKRQLNHQS